MFDTFVLILKITSCRINEYTKKKIHFTQTALIVNEKIKNSDKYIKYSEDQVINKGLDKLLKSMGLEMKEEEHIDTTTIQVMEGILKKERIDNNFKPSTKRILKSLSQALFDEGILSKEPKYDEMVMILIKDYVERFPKLKKYTLQQQYIDQEFRTKELRKKKGITE